MANFVDYSYDMPDINELLRNSDRAYLLVRNPSSVFVCWTWSRARAEAFTAGVYDGEILIKLSAEDDNSPASEYPASWAAGKLYLKPPAGGRICTASVFARKKDGSREKLMDSNSALVPGPAAAPGLESGYASAEFFRKEPV